MSRPVLFASCSSSAVQSHLALYSIRRILYSRIGGCGGEGRQRGQADDIVVEVRARQLRSCSNCKSKSILFLFSRPYFVSFHSVFKLNGPQELRIALLATLTATTTPSARFVQCPFIQSG